MNPTRVQLSRRKGWRKPKDTIVVSRPSVYGNPFASNIQGNDWAVMMFGLYVGNRWGEIQSELRKVGTGIAAIIRMTFDLKERREKLDARLSELLGKNLACWCRLDERCHADVLLEWVNK